MQTRRTHRPHQGGEVSAHLRPLPGLRSFSGAIRVVLAFIAQTTLESVNVVAFVDLGARSTVAPDTG